MLTQNLKQIITIVTSLCCKKKKTLKELARLGIPVDNGQYKRDVYIISDFSELEIDVPKEAGFKVDILIKDVAAQYGNLDTLQSEKKK